MIDEDKLSQVKEIITHANCADGMASAMILSDVLHDVPIKFLHPSSPEHVNLEAKTGQLFCDIAPPWGRVSEFVDADPIVLDHHKTAVLVVGAFRDGVFATENEGLAGAGLAFREVWQPLRKRARTKVDYVCRFAHWANLRDTWQKNNLEWDDASAQGEVLTFYPSEYWLDSKKACLNPEQFKLGEALYAKRLREAEDLCNNSFRFKVDELNCALFPSTSPQLTSNTSEKLRAEGINVSFGFDYFVVKGKPRIRISIRSDDWFDAADFAEYQRGLGLGGGHSKAAGFSCAAFNPYKTLPGRLDKFLSREVF